MNYLPIINVKRIAFGFGLFFGLLTGVHSQESVHRPDLSGQPMLLYFRLGKALVDNGYMDNARTLRHLDEVLSDRSLTGRIDSINILSFASPDGNRKYNERLARQRSTAVKGYLVWKYPYLDQYRIHPRPQGENWQELRRLIAGDEHLPNREKCCKSLITLRTATIANHCSGSWTAGVLTATSERGCCNTCAMPPCAWCG